jgi:hypothetical protein
MEIVEWRQVAQNRDGWRGASKEGTYTSLDSKQPQKKAIQNTRYGKCSQQWGDKIIQYFIRNTYMDKNNWKTKTQMGKYYKNNKRGFGLT